MNAIPDQCVNPSSGPDSKGNLLTPAIVEGQRRRDKDSCSNLSVEHQRDDIQKTKFFWKTIGVEVGVG